MVHRVRNADTEIHYFDYEMIIRAVMMRATRVLQCLLVLYPNVIWFQISMIDGRIVIMSSGETLQYWDENIDQLVLRERGIRVNPVIQHLVQRSATEQFHHDVENARSRSAEIVYRDDVLVIRQAAIQFGLS